MPSGLPQQPLGMGRTWQAGHAQMQPSFNPASAQLPVAGRASTALTDGPHGPKQSWRNQPPPDYDLMQGDEQMGWGGFGVRDCPTSPPIEESDSPGLESSMRMDMQQHMPVPFIGRGRQGPPRPEHLKAATNCQLPVNATRPVDAHEGSGWEQHAGA